MPTDDQIAQALSSRGMELPTPATPVAAYVPAVAVPDDSRLVMVSGQIPVVGGELMARGQVPSEVDLETAVRCAERCAVNALAALKAEIGSLDRLRRVVKIEGFVACGPGFPDQPKVIDGASRLLAEVLGDEIGRHARAAVGVPALPLNVPVEIAFTFAVAKS